MKKGAPICVLAAVSCCAVPVRAQTSCELHVIPTAKFAVVDNTQSYVTTGGGGLAGSAMGGLMAIKDPKAIEELLASSLPADQQQQVLRTLNLQKILKIPNYVAIYHNVIEDEMAKKIMKNESVNLSKRVKDFFNYTQFGPRLTQSTSSCYAELRVNSIYYEKTPLSKKIYAVFIFRKFNSEPTPFFAAVRQSGEHLSDFPPKTETEIEVVGVQLREAFAKTLDAFAAKYVK